MLKLLRYVALNPVGAGMVERPASSSWRRRTRRCGRIELAMNRHDRFHVTAQQVETTIDGDPKVLVLRTRRASLYPEARSETERRLISLTLPLAQPARIA